MADEKVGALTNRDLKELGLESSHLDAYATRGFQDFLVTLPDEADFPFELQHDLTPALPTGVRYEVLQSTYPVVLYHSPGDLWLPGVVTLRATVGQGEQIRIRLTVDDGDASPLLEATQDNPTEGFFPNGLAGGAVEIGTLRGGTAGTEGSIGAGIDINRNRGEAAHEYPKVSLVAASDGNFNGLHVLLKPTVAVNQGLPLMVRYNTVSSRFELVPGDVTQLAVGAHLGSDFETARGAYWTKAWLKDCEAFNGYTERGRTVKMGDWADYTPVWSSTGTQPSLGDGQLLGQWTRIGETVFFDIRLTMGASTTYGTGSWLLSFPVASSVGTLGAFNAHYRESGVQHVMGGARLNTSTTLVMLVDGGVNVSPTTPFTWGSGDQIFVSGCYKA